jgi:hypothetical protein
MYEGLHKLQSPANSGSPADTPHMPNAQPLQNVNNVNNENVVEPENDNDNADLLEAAEGNLRLEGLPFAFGNPEVEIIGRTEKTDAHWSTQSEQQENQHYFSDDIDHDLTAPSLVNAGITESASELLNNGGVTFGDGSWTIFNDGGDPSVRNLDVAHNGGISTNNETQSIPKAIVKT